VPIWYPMPNLTVAVLGSPEFAKSLGKRGTTSDITFYNARKGDATLTVIDPTRYPERLAPLFFAISLADVVVLVIEEINATLGECLLLLTCAGKRSGVIILRNYIEQSRVFPLLKGTAAESYTMVPDDPLHLREELFRLPPSTTKTAKEPTSLGSSPSTMYSLSRVSGPLFWGASPGAQYGAMTRSGSSRRRRAPR